MGDFYQNGIITTLHDLRQRSLDDLEAELLRFSAIRPLGLILPCLYSELEGPAMPVILEHLRQVPYLREIIIGLDRADARQFRRAVEFFAPLPQPHRILWNDGPRLRAIDARLDAVGLPPGNRAKAAMSGSAWATRWLRAAANPSPCTTATSLPTTARCWPA